MTQTYEAPPGQWPDGAKESSFGGLRIPQTEDTPKSPKFQHRRSLVSDPRVCRLLQQVYDTGPRALLEMLDEASDRDDTMFLLAKYARTADLMKAMGAGDLPAPFIAGVLK